MRTSEEVGQDRGGTGRGGGQGPFPRRQATPGRVFTPVSSRTREKFGQAVPTVRQAPGGVESGLERWVTGHRGLRQVGPEAMGGERG